MISTWYIGINLQSWVEYFLARFSSYPLYQVCPLWRLSKINKYLSSTCLLYIIWISSYGFIYIAGVRIFFYQNGCFQLNLLVFLLKNMDSQMHHFDLNNVLQIWNSFNNKSQMAIVTKKICAKRPIFNDC